MHVSIRSFSLLRRNSNVQDLINISFHMNVISSVESLGWRRMPATTIFALAYLLIFKDLVTRVGIHFSELEYFAVLGIGSISMLK